MAGAANIAIKAEFSAKECGTELGDQFFGRVVVQPKRSRKSRSEPRFDLRPGPMRELVEDDI